MTLDTRMFVRGQADHRELFARCNAFLGADEATRSEDKQDTSYRDGEWVTLPDGPWTLMNEPDQGLPGWLMIHYRPGAPLRAGVEHDDCEPDCDYAGHITPCWLEISLDTAYSYRDALGGCGDMHARFVAEIGHWLDERGVPWSWENEFTGEVHERYDGLDDLGNAGAEAAAWMRSTVLPALAAGFNERT